MEELEKLSDEELAVRACEDKECFGILISRYESKLSRYIKRLTSSNEEDIADILQNSFMKAYLNIYSFNSSLKFSSWIYRITHNESISLYRKKKINPVIDVDDEILLETLASDTDLEQEHFDNENRNLVLDLINKLPEKYKDVLVLKFLEDKDYSEISDILKIPEGTVATRINRAKSQIRDKYKALEKKYA